MNKRWVGFIVAACCYVVGVAALFFTLFVEISAIERFMDWMDDMRIPLNGLVVIMSIPFHATAHGRHRVGRCPAMARISGLAYGICLDGDFFGRRSDIPAFPGLNLPGDSLFIIEVNNGLSCA